uniref:Prohead core protein n=1 Tax=Globodera pallida TaxID=36090 RepID=A0A183C4Q8_GLOPA
MREKVKALRLARERNSADENWEKKERDWEIRPSLLIDRKDEKISAQKSAIKEALKKLSKNITNEDVANLLTQIGLLADHMVAQAKDTVAGMEPYSFKVELDDGPKFSEELDDGPKFSEELDDGPKFSEELDDGRKFYILDEDVERPQTVAYYELMFSAELEKVKRCFAGEKSTDGGQTYELNKSYDAMIAKK